jgi:predicted NAD-dependent protein-ADP-ribosyltransferase YbiA (DUF1768 family)
METKSRLIKGIVYPEKKGLEDDDKNYDTDLYEIEIFERPYIIAVGQEKTIYEEQDVIFFPVYLIEKDKVSMQIGIFEILVEHKTKIYDDDGDIKVEELGDLLLYPSARDMFKHMKQLHDGLGIPDEQEVQEGDVEVEDVGEVVDKQEKEKETQGEEEQIDLGVIDLDEQEKEQEKVIEQKEKVEASQLDEYVFDNELEEQDAEQSVKEKKAYKKTKGEPWIQTFMKNNNYAFIDNEGSGDCLFASIRDGLSKVGRNVSVSQMRQILVDEANDMIFMQYRDLYNSFAIEVKRAENQLKELVAKHKELKLRVKKAKEIKEQEAIVEQANKVVEQHKKLKQEYVLSKQLLQEYMFMKDIETLDDFKALIQSSIFWGDTWSISTLERVLNIKLILFSLQSFKSKDMGNVLQCGQLNDDILQQKGVFKPDVYILLEYMGNHYKLITYKDRGAFRFKELPFDIRQLIINRCLEGQSAPFLLIPEFKAYVKHKHIEIPSGPKTTPKPTQKLTIKPKLVIKPKPKLVIKPKQPIDEEQEGEQEKMEQAGNDNEDGNEDEQIIVPDPAEPLYDENTIFQFYSKSADAKPGRGSGETIRKEDMLKYSDLASIPEWRKKLSNFWISPFQLDGYTWNSVEHYYQANKFKKNNPEFYRMFSISASPDEPIAQEAEIAKAAGGKTGKYKAKLIRPSKIKIDPDFFDGRHIDVMENAMRAKFTQNPELRQLLIATKNAKLQHYVRGNQPVIFEDLMRVRLEIINQTK